MIKTTVRTLINGADHRRTCRARNLAHLKESAAPGAFARISYTNKGAHAPQTTWYPIMLLDTLQTDFQFVTE